MDEGDRLRRSRLALTALSIIGAVGFPLASMADVTSAITSDGTLGTAITAAGGVFDISGGTIKGGNQFHSFGRFSVGTGDAAIFGGPAGIQNVLSRVTGGFRSEIDGTLGSSIPGANLFLMNPNGILFGPNSQLDLGGSFHGTTADFIGFADGSQFTASPSPSDGLLSSAAPERFGFLNPAPAPIEVNTPSVLQVPSGQTLSFVGGDLTLGAADFSAPSYLLAGAGRINLASVASAGEATLDGGAVNVDSFGRLGDVTIQGGSLVDARDVYIRAGNFVLDESIIIPGVFSFFDLSPAPDGGAVDIAARGDVTITGTQPEAITDNPPGILTFSGSTDEIADATDVPDVFIAAGGDFTLSGFAAVQTLRFGPGAPADVVVNAGDVTIDDGGGVAMFNFFEGSGGTMTVNGDNVNLIGLGEPGGTTGATGLLSQGVFHFIYGVTSIDPALANGDSGTIDVKTSESLRVAGAAQITTDSLNFGASDDIHIAARNVSLTDRGGLISAQSLYAGDAGVVAIDATENVRIDNGFVVAASTFGTGDSGGATVTAADNVIIQGVASGIATQTAPPSSEQSDNLAALFLGAGSTLADLAAALGLDPNTADLVDVLIALNDFGLTDIPDPVHGDGGSIVVDATRISVDGQDSAIDSSTAWDGNAGTVVAAAQHVIVSGGSQIRSRSGLRNIETGEFVVGSGNAGAVSIAGIGDSTISITGADSAVSTTTFGEGDGGAIIIDGANIRIAEGGEVTADSTGSGLTGDIRIVATSKIRMENGSVSTSATTSDGGNIDLLAPNLIHLRKSVVTTSVESGAGAGGNILVDPEFVVLSNSDIIANAFGGPGGNIRIVADNFILSADSSVEASSQLGVQGTIVIESPENDVAGQVAKLPSDYLSTDDLLAERCAARRTGSESSFVILGDRGLPMDPDGYLPSFDALGNIPARVAGSVHLAPAGNSEPYLGLRGLKIAFAGAGCH